MSAVAITQRQHVVATPGMCGGRPRIDGTRIRVQDVYVWHEMSGLSPDEIVSRFPQLTLANVYAALSCFWDHREEILSDIREASELVDTLRRSNPSRLPDRNAERRA